MIPKAVSLYEVAPLGFVADFFIHYWNNERTNLRVTGSPSSFVVRKIISDMNDRKNRNTLLLLLLAALYFL